MTRHPRMIPEYTEKWIVSAIHICSMSACVAVLLVLLSVTRAIAADATPETLAGIRAFSVVVEDLQPDVQKYAPRFGLTKDQLRKDIEKSLYDAGIAVLTGGSRAGTADGSILYLHVNTVNYQKYWYSYTVSLQVKQIPVSQIVTDLKSLPHIWSIDVSGTANIGTLNTVKENALVLVGKFISAFTSANGREYKQK